MTTPWWTPLRASSAEPCWVALRCTRVSPMRSRLLERCGFNRQSPAFSSFNTVTWPEDIEIRYKPQRHDLFNRLVGGPIFTNADGIMRHNIRNAGFLKRRQTNGSAAIIREDQERSAIRNNATMQRHAVHGRRHRMLAHAVMDIAAVPALGRHRRGVAGRGGDPRGPPPRLSVKPGGPLA